MIEGSIVGTVRTIFLGGSTLSAGQSGLSDSAIAVWSRLPLLLTLQVASSETFLILVFLPVCWLGCKAQLFKLS